MCVILPSLDLSTEKKLSDKFSPQYNWKVFRYFGQKRRQPEPTRRGQREGRMNMRLEKDDKNSSLAVTCLSTPVNPLLTPRLVIDK